MDKMLFGFRNIYYALYNEVTDDYDTPVHIAGGVNLTLAANSSNSTFYADDSPYVSMYSNNGFTGTIDLANLDDDFLINVMGYEKDDGGGLVQLSNSIAKSFALIFELTGTEGTIYRTIFYYCSIGISDYKQETIADSVVLSAKTLPITVTPKVIAGKSILQYTISSKDTGNVFSNFFTSVYLPNFTPSTPQHG